MEYKIEKAKPFLRWAGGKRWFLKELDKLVDINKYNTYHEPFIGGGSVFFHLKPRKAVISDSNPELINVYNQLKYNVEETVSTLKNYEKSEEFYYKIRSQVFSSKIEEAAKFIFLNQLSFNGIYRVNSRGEYNVPYGRRNSFNFDFDNLFEVNKLLENTEIIKQDFEDTLQKVKEDDFIFLDPPYTVTHNQNGFIHYNQKLFSLEDQYRLSDYIKQIKVRGAFYILTNAAHQVVKEIFSNGDRMYEVDRASIIGGKNAKRGKYSELILTNL
ncbi:DNA adenine methylase [Pontibacter locisalis]|uniref:Site-specific DNA-methyltransferase (adenine-specific) n=1 Tax=Pontibacter locisalis TaxID=1719035 RepID=A0ABW5II33_9BACT